MVKLTRSEMLLAIKFSSYKTKSKLTIETEIFSWMSKRVSGYHDKDLLIDPTRPKQEHIFKLHFYI